MAHTGQPSSNLIIPFASSLGEGCQAAIKKLSLPNLSQFLKAADLVREDNGDEFDFTPPHERALGVTDQIIVTPCHWRVGIDHIGMDNPADLALHSDESQALFETIRPYFLEDGIELKYAAPLRWYAQSHALQGLELASLDRVIGRNVDVWQPQTDASKPIRRLQNEMQMLLYTHLINDVREAQGLPTVNSFWLSYEINLPVDEVTGLHNDLRECTLRGDWASWSNSWQAIDNKALQHIRQITLCGERNAHTYAIPATRNLGNIIRRLLKPAPSIQSVLSAL